MGIIKQFHKGAWRYCVSRRLPPNRIGMRHFRRWYEKRSVAKHVLDTLNGAIAKGEINDVLPALVGKGELGSTVVTFWPRFRDEYCKPRLSSWRRYQQSFNFILPKLGSIPIASFRRGDLHEYLEDRVKGVSRSTANKDIAALKKMFSFAVEVGAVSVNPLTKFATFRVQEKALRLPTVAEYHGLVEAQESPELAALVAVLGETAMRRSEALGLQWSQVDLRARKVVIEHTKGRKVRTVPLSDFAIEKLRQVVRIVGNPNAFVYSSGAHAGQRIRKPYRAFRKAAEAVNLGWVTFHTLRHMRATLWLQEGVDIKSVKEALGHSAIATTMRYLKHVESHADRAIREAQEAEKAEMGKTAEISSERDSCVRRDE